MTKYEIEVLKKFLNEAMRQLDAEVPGQTIIPGYADTDESKVYLAEEGYITFKVNAYERNRGYIADLILSGVKSAGYFAVCLRGDKQAQMDAYKGFVNEIMDVLDNILRGE